MHSSAVWLDIVSVSIFGTASPSLLGAENESLNTLLNWSQVSRLLFSLACIQKDCFHNSAVPSFIKDRTNMICRLSLLYVSSFMMRYMSVSIRNSSSFFLSPVKGVSMFIFTSFWVALTVIGSVGVELVLVPHVPYQIWVVECRIDSYLPLNQCLSFGFEDWFNWYQFVWE